MNMIETGMGKILTSVRDIIPDAYMVGGCLRDLQIGVEPKDYDFTTHLHPDDIEAAVRAAGRRPYIVGKRFGTIGFKVHVPASLGGSDKFQFVEVTTFRTEKYEEGNRKPKVEFVDNLSHDLSRRDFTINSMAWDGKKITDPHGGIEDLSNRILRAVGNPTIRFKEDPLRILRAARFIAKFGFSMDEQTFKSATKVSHHILDVSRERWVMELDKLLVADWVDMGLSFMAKVGVLKFVFPELSLQVDFDQDSPYHTHDLWNHTLMVVMHTPADVNLRWAALLHDVGKPFTKVKNKKGYSNYIHHDTVGAEIVLKIAKYLRWSGDRTEKVHELVKTHLEDDSPLREADKNAH